MTDGVELKVRVVFNEIPRIQRRFMPLARQAVAKAALDMEAGMKRRISAQGAVDTGFLLNSVQARQVGGNATAGSITWRVTVGADYGIYVDQGTRYMVGRPFFHPTIDEVRPVFLEAMRRISQL